MKSHSHATSSGHTCNHLQWIDLEWPHYELQQEILKGDLSGETFDQ